MSRKNKISEDLNKFSNPLSQVELIEESEEDVDVDISVIDVDDSDDLEEESDEADEADEVNGKEKENNSSSLESILYKIPYVSNPLVGSPKQIQKQLDSIALKIQKNPEKYDYLYNTIQVYMHGYLINVAVKQFPYIKGYQTVDIYQESLIALRFKAIPNFKIDRGMSFLNFAKMCVRRHLITLLNTSITRKRDQSMNTAVSIDVTIDDEDGSTLLSTLKDTSVGFEKLSERKEAFEFTKDALMGMLSDFEKDVLNEYLSNSSYNEIARNITKKNNKRCLSKAVDNALLRIRKKATILKDTKLDDDLPMFI